MKNRFLKTPSWIHSEIFWLVLISVLVYWPVFLIQYTMHGDPTLVAADFTAGRLQAETVANIVLGRAFLAIGQNALGCLVHRTADLGFYRFLFWMFLMSSIILFLRFLRCRYGLSPFWLFFIGAAIMLAPASQLCFMYLMVGCQCAFGIFPAAVSYVLLDKYWPVRGSPLTGELPHKGWGGIIGLVISGLLFIVSLFVYQPNAMIVSIFPLAAVLFKEFEGWRQTRKIVVRDVCFYGALMIVYLVLLLKMNMVIFGGLIPQGTVIPSFTGSYETAVEFNPHIKVKLLLGIIRISWLGAWPLAFRGAGGWVPALVLIAAAGISALDRRGKNPRTDIRRKNATWLVQALLAGAILFLFAIAPSFMAKGCIGPRGYRMLLVPACFIQLFYAGLLYYLMRSIVGPKALFFVKGCLIAYIIAMAALAAWNVKFCADKFNKQLRFAWEKTLAAGPKTQSVQFILPQEDPDIKEFGPNLPYEFNGAFSVDYFIHEVRAQQGLPKLPVNFDLDDLVFYDEHTLIIDAYQQFPMEGYKGPARKPRVKLSSSGLPGQDVGIARQSDYFVFSQPARGARQPFWLAFPTAEGEPWFQLEFEDAPARLAGFIFGLYSKVSFSTAPVILRVQASENGENWVSWPISEITQDDKDPNLKAFITTRRPAQYKFYRFFLSPVDNKWPLVVMAVRMELKLLGSDPSN